MPSDQVFYSSGLVEKTDNFDRAHIDKKNGLSLLETMERIRTSNSYVMVRKPETHASFRDLFSELKGEVEGIMADAGAGTSAHDAMLYLFIASPGSVTPFHIDRYSTFLMQFHGKKTLYVYPPFREEIVNQAVYESFVAKSGRRPNYDPSLDHYAEAFSFHPGETLHIPFLAPHHVKNGPDEVSISLSIIFNTEITWRQIGAMRFNDKLRRSMGRVGISPGPVGRSRLVDGAKAFAFDAANGIRGRDR